jgi:hypothetical protein
VTREVRRIDYPDGGWCLQEYEDGELHGSWRVFHADGSVSWERQYEHGLQHGVARTFDITGRLQEEQWFVDGALHGPWTLVGADGATSVREFLFGYTVQTLRNPANPDFRDSILPLLDNAFAPTPGSAGMLLESLRKPTIGLRRGAPVPAQDQALCSYLGHVNVLGADDPWPENDGRLLSPILQLVTSELPLRVPPWDAIDVVTIFAEPDGVPTALGDDLVVRVYRSSDRLRTVAEPVTRVCEPCRLDFDADAKLSRQERPASAAQESRQPRPFAGARR